MGRARDNVSRQLDLAEDPAEQTAYMLRLAALREHRMGAVEAAIEIYREVLSRDPSNPEALSALERLMQKPEHELAIAEVLEPLYGDSAEYRKLVGVHEIQARHAGSVEQRVLLLHTIADCTRRSSASWSVQSMPTRAHSAKTLRTTRPSRSSSAWHFRPTTRPSLLRSTSSKSRRYRSPGASLLHVKAAQIRENMLGDVHAAVGHYCKVLEHDAHHLEAASALERLYLQSEQYEALASIYLAKSKMLSEIEDQKQYLYRAAQIHEEVLNQPLLAVDVYKQVLELDGEDLHSLDQLSELI